LRHGASTATVCRICTDSRQTQPGDLFFALKGKRSDGHAFISDVAAKGAAAVVVKSEAPLGEMGRCAVVTVPDPRKALGLLAASYRSRFELPIAAVAGSNGKTTTKDLISSVLRQSLATLASEASYNNDLGVPLSLLKLETTHQAAVLEVGTNHPGELSQLVEMIRPRFGVITCIGREHLEFFGDVQGVAQEQGWLAQLLPATGKLFLNGDSPWTDAIAGRARASVVRVGLGAQNDWRASELRLDKHGLRFRAHSPIADFCGEYRVGLLGRHQAVNALMAAALGAELGLSRCAVEQGLAQCQPPRLRMQVWELNGVRVLDDAYNANADSVVAALETLHELPCKGRRIAVLGDMAELGVHSFAAHEEVGRRAAELGVGQLFTVGQMAPVVAQAARQAGLNRVLEFADVDAAAAALKTFLRTGDLLLLKASRVARLERISESLRAAETGRKN
jgi:UDP-N-acetylmuramoyl-tripeptide--D-alanyl-D-alanine ligase